MNHQIEIPSFIILKETHTSTLQGPFKESIAQAKNLNLALEDYLKHVQKTRKGFLGFNVMNFCFLKISQTLSNEIRIQKFSKWAGSTAFIDEADDIYYDKTIDSSDKAILYARAFDAFIAAMLKQVLKILSHLKTIESDDTAVSYLQTLADMNSDDEPYGLRLNKTHLSIFGEWTDAKSPWPCIIFPQIYNDAQPVTGLQFQGLHLIVAGSSQFKTSSMLVLSKWIANIQHTWYFTFLERENLSFLNNYKGTSGELLKYTRIGHEDMITQGLFLALSSGSVTFFDALSVLAKTPIGTTQTYGVDTGLLLIFYSLNSRMLDINPDLSFFSALSPPLQAEGYLSFLNEYSLCSSGLWIPLWVDEKEEVAIMLVSQRKNLDPSLMNEEVDQESRLYTLTVIDSRTDSKVFSNTGVRGISQIDYKITRNDVMWLASVGYDMPLQNFKTDAASIRAVNFSASFKHMIARTDRFSKLDPDISQILMQARDDKRPSFLKAII